VIDVLFLALVVVAKEIAAADHKYEVFLDVETCCVFKLKIKEFVVVEQVETAELITR
jgi:hypothetical protein